LLETKKRIVYNLSDVDEIIEFSLGKDVDMDPAGITLRDIFYNHQDKEGNRLIDAIEKNKHWRNVSLPVPTKKSRGS
jgi:hypothetical protein